jgi:hypothetical protein
VNYIKLAAYPRGFQFEHFALAGVCLLMLRVVPFPAIQIASVMAAPYKHTAILAMANTSQFGARVLSRLAKSALCVVALLVCAASASAQLNFDVFVGHGLGLADSSVAEASWFPVTCEIQNDGPSFNAVVEISGGQFGGGQTRRVAVELPTHTKKRFTVPLYCTTRYRTSVDARLFNERDKIIAERVNIEARAVADWQSPLIASLSRTHGGAATLPEAGKNSSLRPVTTHLSPELFPDNPLTLESISMLYLHSSRAVELKVPQVNALLAWLHNGGHLVLAVEQPGDVNGVAWLQGLLPCTLGDVTPRNEHGALQQWLTSAKDDEKTLRIKPRNKSASTQQSVINPFTQLANDSDFDSAALPVVNATLRDGAVLIGTAGAPLAIAAPRGRGQITVLLFSPELEPFRSWRNRNWFWARLGGVPLEWLASAQAGNSGSMSLDGLFGAMVDSKQIRKLPVGWLLLLLLAYLVVIGPLDQYWLKKINKQMLTWVTFPTYVVLFSLLIYFIGYKLRSGEMEWNELHVVDVTPHGERADFRGRVFCSAYSPANARYNVASEQTFSTLRGEVGQGGAQEISKAVVEQRGNGFVAQLSVPVWTSQLFVNDWWRQGSSPLNVAVASRGDQFDVVIENPLGKRIPQAKLIIDGRVYDLGDITKGKTASLPRSGGNLLQAIVQLQVNQFTTVVQQRQNQFGAQQSGHLDDAFSATAAASFLGVANMTGGTGQPMNYTYWNRFATPPGFDLTPLMQRGDAILLAWVPGETIVPTLNKFSPRYSKKDTILRIAVPMAK